MIYKDEFSHDRKLGGEGLVMQGQKRFRFFYLSHKFTGTAIHPTTKKRCLLVEPEYARRNSCHNGLKEQQIFDSTNPFMKGNKPRKKDYQWHVEMESGTKVSQSASFQKKIMSPLDMD